MSSSPILVTGATGKTGRRVVANLQARGIAVRAVSRKSTPSFDWNDPATWAGIFADVRAVYIVHASLGTPEAAEQVREFAHAAAAAGVKKAVLVATPDHGGDFSEAVRATEKNIVDAGLQLTSLRLRWFFQNFSEDFLLDPVLSSELRLSAGTGKEAFVDADDIAEVAVAALTDDRHNGRFYEITGPRLLGFADIAEEITRGTDHALTYVPLEPDAFIAEQRAYGVPDEWVYVLNAMYQDIASQKLETVSGDVEAILGKPARDFSDYVAQMAQAGTWTGDKTN